MAAALPVDPDITLECDEEFNVVATDAVTGIAARRLKGPVSRRRWRLIFTALGKTEKDALRAHYNERLGPVRAFDFQPDDEVSPLKVRFTEAVFRWAKTQKGYEIRTRIVTV